jgi:coproporphyrinogen III oxidase
VEELWRQNLLTALRVSQMTAKRMIQHGERAERSPARCWGPSSTSRPSAAQVTRPELLAYSMAAAATDQRRRLMSVMRGGRVFEKVGVNVSTVHGTLGERAQKAMAARGVPGMAEDPRFWASGISLVAHMQNPHAPAVHMNTRMFWTPTPGGSAAGRTSTPASNMPRTPRISTPRCRRPATARPDYYPRFKAWADEYFFVPHRGRARGRGRHLLR